MLASTMVEMDGTGCLQLATLREVHLMMIAGQPRTAFLHDADVTLDDTDGYLLC